MCAASDSAQLLVQPVLRIEPLPFSAPPHCCVQVMQEVGQEVEGYMTSIFGKDRPDKDAEVVFLTKFIVKPEIALDFIGAIKKVRIWPHRCTALAVCLRLVVVGMLQVAQHLFPGLFAYVDTLYLSAILVPAAEGGCSGD